MKRAYADRAVYLGDPATVTAPTRPADVEALCDASCSAGIDPAHATPAHDIHAQAPPPMRATTPRTSRWSDRFGNAVSNTYTLNFSYGSAWWPRAPACCSTTSSTISPPSRARPTPMGSSAATPMRPGPGKRPLSSMTPTIVLKNGRPFLVTGSPGGSRIITAVLQVISNVIDRKLPIADAVAAPRIHDQWSPDEVVAERGFQARSHRRAGRIRPHGAGGRAAHLGQFDPDHAAGICGRCRSAQPRRHGGRLLRRVPQKVEPPLFAGKHSEGSDSQDTLHRRAPFLYPIAASQQRSSCGHAIREKTFIN